MLNTFRVLSTSTIHVTYFFRMVTGDAQKIEQALGRGHTHKANSERFVVTSKKRLKAFQQCLHGLARRTGIGRGHPAVVKCEAQPARRGKAGRTETALPARADDERRGGAAAVAERRAPVQQLRE